jgi:hypothetical protein
MIKRHGKNGPCYQERGEPFFGSLAKARIAFREYHGQPCSAAGFLDYVASEHPELYRGVEWITFRHWQDKDVEWRIALVNTVPNWIIRSALYKIRIEITKATGWYPLIQGSRAKLSALPAPLKSWNAKLLQNSLDLGKIRSLKRVTLHDEDGSAFQLQGECGSLLIDTGLRDPLPTQPDAKAVFLSHFHSDHAGGISSILKQTRIPILMSGHSFVQLSVVLKSQNCESLLSRRSRIFPVGTIMNLPSGAVTRFFPTFHCPGSTGLLYRDPLGKTIIYPGDICLRNSYSDYRKELEILLREAAGAQVTLLLDGTMLERTNQEIPADDTVGSLLDGAIQGISKRNTAFVCDQPETMVYSYLLAFDCFVKAKCRPPILISPVFLQHLRVFWRRVLLEEHGAVADPVLRSLGKHNYQNFAESQQLYPLEESVLATLPDQERCVLFVESRDLTSVKGIAKRLKNANVILLGTLGLRDESLNDVHLAHPRMILRAAGPNWSFHSSQEDVAALCQYCSTQGIRVVLFHNFENRLRRFIQTNGFDTNKVLSIGKESISFDS